MPVFPALPLPFNLPTVPGTVTRSLGASFSGGRLPTRLPQFQPSFNPEELLNRLVNLIPVPPPMQPIKIPSVRSSFNLPQFVENVTRAQLGPVQRTLGLREQQERAQLRGELAAAGLAESGVSVGAQGDLAARFQNALQSAAETAAASAAATGAQTEVRLAELEQNRAITEAQVNADMLREQARLALQRGATAAQLLPQVFRLAVEDIESQRRAFLDSLGEQGRLEIQRSELAQRAAADMFEKQLRLLDLALRAGDIRARLSPLEPQPNVLGGTNINVGLPTVTIPPIIRALSRIPGAPLIPLG